MRPAFGKPAFGPHPLSLAALLAAFLFSACGERQDPADFAGGIPIGTELRQADFKRTLEATGAKLIVAAVYMPD